MELESALKIVDKAEESIKDRFKEIDKVCECNQYKVLKAMQDNRLALRHFSESTGYAYGDEGRVRWSGGI